MSNWDKQWVGDDGSINATYYVSDLAYDIAYAKYNQAPVGDKHELAAEVIKHGSDYLVRIDGQVIGRAPITWSRLDGRLKAGPIRGEATLQWRAYDSPQRFMLKLYIKNA